MKVKCTMLCNSEGEPVDFSSWLTVGCVYHVMSISKDSDGKCYYQIITSAQRRGYDSMGYFSSVAFEVISSYRPSCWRDQIIGNGGTIETLPEAWMVDDFLDKLYDGDPEVNLIFERERDAIFAEEPE